LRRMVVVGIGGTAAALLAAALAFGQVQDRFRVASDPEARGYPSSLVVVIDSPPAYVRDFIGRGGNDGEWKGPRYEATLSPSLGGESSLGWSAGVYRTPSNRQTILANLVHDWQSISEGTEPIERRVGGRDVGTLPGTWMLTQGTPMDGEARYELGLVFPLCGRTAFLLISALTPAGDSAGGAMGFGDYRIEGMAPTAWNREQVLATLRGVSLEGSLPAGRIAARAQGRRVTGSVTDCNGHAVAGVPARLERQSGRRWARAAAGTTSGVGAFSLRAPSAGTYRVTAGGRRSGTIRVR
jgi:hypothetical protein